MLLDNALRFEREGQDILEIYGLFSYLTSSAAAISMSMQYFAFGLSPFTTVLYAGNIRLKINFNIIISLEKKFLKFFDQFWQNFEKKN